VSVCGGRTTHHMSTIQVEGCQKLKSNSYCFHHEPNKPTPPVQTVSMLHTEFAVVLQGNFHTSPQPPLFSHVFEGEGFSIVLAANLRTMLLDTVEEMMEEAGILVEDFWMTWRLHGRSIRLHSGEQFVIFYVVSID
jgi:hypothetical protein